MSRCPFCNGIIESLVTWSNVNMRDKYSYNEDDGHIYVQRTFETTSERLKFRCPRCGKVVFYGSEKVEEFLRDD